MLNVTQTKQYHDLCEDLGGYSNEHWRALIRGAELTVETNLGVTVNGSPIGQRWGVVTRVHFDLDWESYLLVQVWDHSVAFDQHQWEYVMLFNTARNHWVPEQVYSWGSCCPSYAEAGAVVDMILESRRTRQSSAT
jgi:hypothetical protein